MSHDMVTQADVVDVDSQLIVTLAKQALVNLPHYESTQHYFGISQGEFRKSFRTVAIAMPRQSGHSTAALQLMYEYPNSMLFVHSGSAKIFVRHLLKDYITDPTVRSRIIRNIKVLAGTTLKDINPMKRDFIIFDQFSNMKEADIDLAYKSVHASIVLKLQ